MKLSEYKLNHKKLEKGFRDNNLDLLCEVASESANLSQQVQPKKTYDSIVSNQEKYYSDCIFVAHTCSIIGYLFKHKVNQQKLEELTSFYKQLGYKLFYNRVG